MGEKFKDFPCLYYLDGRVNRKSRIQFYSMLASMFGQTPEQAAQNSELFAHASGKLFGGTGYTLEEIRTNAGNSFDKPYKDCRGFYRRKAFDEAGLKENCCAICMFSHSYLNECLEQERQILRILSEQRELIGLTDCSTADFKSKLAISCSNDLSECPIIPFNAYFFEYLLRYNEIDTGSIVTFISNAMAENGLFVSEEKLLLFIKTQIGIISQIELPGGERTSVLLYALNGLRESRDYTPPQLVHPSSIKKGKKDRSSVSEQDELARLLADIGCVKYVPAQNNVEMYSEEYIPSNESAETDVIDTVDESFSFSDIETSDSTPNDADALLEELFTSIPTVRTANDDVTPSHMSEVVYSCPGEQDDLLDANDIPARENVDAITDTAPVISDNVGSEDVAELTDEFCEDIALSVDTGAGDNVESSCDDGRHVVSSVTIEPVFSDASILSDGDENGADEVVDCPDDEPMSFDANGEDDEDECEDALVSSSRCCICHGVPLDKYMYSEEWMHGLYRHCMACENAVAKDEDKPFFSAALTHPDITSGCAFSCNEPEAGCVYGDVPIELSDDFVPIISDCSDYACELSNLVSFIEACDNASCASVECVNIYGIDGLLFYVAGAYYFIGGGTTACAAMKKLFSNAERFKLYSLNPLMVHVKLLRFGLRHVKIESLAVRYSVFVGTDILLPPSVLFVTNGDGDLYRTVMPQYEKLFERTVLAGGEKKRYEKMMRLEWALAASVDTSFIALGANRSVYGSNALNYRFSLLDVGKICREGTLYVVTLDEDSKIPPEEERLLWEDVAGRLASSSLSCMNYSFILGLGKGISYFACFEEEAFFDSLMASARSAYKKAYKREVHLQVTREKYITN